MQYRIIRNNKSPIGYRYYIQKKYFGLFWFNILVQGFNEFDLEHAEYRLKDVINRAKEYKERKQTKNNEVVK